MFMGDVGSVPLGFLAGALGLIGWREGAWPFWFPMLVFAPFTCDATLTLLKRALRRERVWQAHREHYYQRLVRMGFGHRGALWIECTAMAGCAATAIAVRDAGESTQFAALGTATLALIALAVWIDTRWSRWVRRDGAGSAPA
jgi:UDP-N-acetylmuramyl pentapeptide phosphotransferase/UDP-N-acetylglucosamine-1-phosphate transferase